MSVALVLFVGGVVLVALVVFWLRQRTTETGMAAGKFAGADYANLPYASAGDAVIVSRQHGQVIYANQPARALIGMNGGDPNLEQIARQVAPADSFLELLADERQASFQLGKRWVEASSHRIPADGEMRTVIVMRELTAAASSASPDALDLSSAMGIINQIGETIDVTSGVEQTLQSLLLILKQHVDYDAAEINLLDRDQRTLEPRGYSGDSTYIVQLAEAGGRYALDEGITGWIATQRAPLVLRSAAEIKAAQPKVEALPFASIVGVPLLLGSALIGTLELAARTSQRYTQAHMALLQAVSKPVSLAIYNATVYAEQVRRMQAITGLQQTVETDVLGDTGQSIDSEQTQRIYDALSRHIANLMDADMCGIFLYDETRASLMPQLPFYGLPEALARTMAIPMPPDSPQRDIWQNQPYWIANDVADEALVEALGLSATVNIAGIRNTAWMPLQISRERIGTLTVSNKRGGSFMPQDIQNLQAIAAQAAIVVENLRLYARERRLDAEIAGLQEMTYAIGALTHEEEFYAEITSRIARLMDIEICGILLYDEAQQRLAARLPFYGVDDEAVRSYQISLEPGSVTEELWQEEAFWYSNRVESEALVFAAGLEELARQIGVKKTLIAKLSTGGRALGVVQVSNRRDGSDFDDAAARLLTIYATQAATLLENARLFTEVQRTSEEAQRLRRIAEIAATIVSSEHLNDLLSEIAAYMGSPAVFVNMLDTSGALVTHPNWVYGVTLDEPLTADIYSPGFEHSVLLAKRPFLSNDLQGDRRVLPGYKRAVELFAMRSTVMVPLIAGERAVGELGIANRETPYTRADIALLTTIAAQITFTLERLILFEATGQNLSRRIQELDAVSRVSNELTQTLDFDQILNVIRSEAVAATGATGSTVALLRPSHRWQQADQPELERRLGAVRGLSGLSELETAAIWRGADYVLVPSYEQSEYPPAPADAKSALAAGILYSDQVVGVIHLYHEEPNRFDERAAQFLMTLAAKASLGYGNFIRFNETQERSERLRLRVEQLNRIFELGHMLPSETTPEELLEAVAYSVQTSVGYDTVLVLLADDESGVLRRITQAGMPIDAFRASLGHTIPLAALDALLKPEYRISESYFFPSERVEDWYRDGVDALSPAFDGSRTIPPSSPQSWRDGDLLLVTLLGSDGKLLGLLSLDRPFSDERPERQTIEVLEIFAHQAATTLENMRLFQASSQSAEQEARLNEMLRRVYSTLDTAGIVESVVRDTLALAPFTRADIAVSNAKRSAFDVFTISVDDAGQVAVTRERRPDLGGTLLGQALADGQEHGLRAEDSGAFSDAAAWRDSGEVNGLVLPLIAAEPLGALHIGTTDASDEHFSAHARLYRRIAQLLAGALQNARLFDQAVELQVLNESVIESIQQGIVVLESTGRIVAVNSYMQRYGWGDDALNKDIFAYRPDLAALIEFELQTVLANTSPREIINQNMVVDGRQVVRNIYIYPLRSADVIRGAVILLEDVTDRALLEQAIEQRANQLAALTEVSSRITSSLDRDDVITLALEEMRWLIKYDNMTLWRRNGAQMNLVGTIGGGISPEYRSGASLRISDVDVVRQLVDTQRVVVLDGADAPLVVSAGLPCQSWMGVPLVNQGNVVGMVTLAAQQPDLYESRSDQNIALTFATQVAIALANAELFEQTFDRTNELGILLEASQATSLTQDLDEIFGIVVELMFSALEMDQCSIMIWAQVENVLEVQIDANRGGDAALARPRGYKYDLKRYAARREALVKREVIAINAGDDAALYPDEIDDLKQRGVESRLLVPLVVREESIGLLQLDQQGEGQRISPQKTRLAKALGAQVAIAIENARLSGSMAAMISESLVINDLTSALSRTLNFDEMIKIVRGQVPNVTGAEELYLALYDDSTQQITFPLAVSSGQDIEIPPRPLGNDEVSFVIRRNRVLTIGADYFTPDELRRSLGITSTEAEYKSYMGVPLSAENRVFGVIALRDTQRTSAFTINDQRILTTVGAQLGAAIQNVRLFQQVQTFASGLEKLVDERTQELEEERDRIDTLYRITSELSRSLDMQRVQQRALGMVVKAVGAEDGVILGLDPLTDSLYPQAALNPALLTEDGDGRRHHPGESLGMWLIDNQKSVVIDDLRTFADWDGAQPGTERWRSALAVVLESNENDPQGVMVVFSAETAAFGESEQRLLVAAASQVAAATNNADLYNLIRDQADRLGSLLRAEQEEAEKNASILASIGDGVVLSDAEGKIVLFNTAAEAILGLPREQVIDQPLSRFTGLYDADITAWTQRVTAHTARPDALSGGVVEEQLELGGRIVNVQIAPVFTGQRLLGLVSVFRDVTREVEVDRLKSEFVSSVSHELRTPLTPIKGFTELLLMGAAGPVTEAQQRTLQMIKDNIDRLTILVDDILDISKLDTGRGRLELAPVNVGATLETILANIRSRPQHIRRELDIKLEVAPDLPVLEADPARFARIMSNLIDNAFNYTPNGGTVTIRAAYKPARDQILLSVSDTGVGIAPEFRDDIFKRFQRYEEHALKLDVAGTGLGLAIVKEMTEMHHGEVWFESELGQGTTFYVQLPLSQAGLLTRTGGVSTVAESEE
ncbi:MAG TPA: GAF domain-containing protein [Aggregatilineales bacterium]|nr:GAF domain-containing protein [Aggregatilineales bacterium]